MEEQQLEPHALSGFPMKATLLAAGNAYHYSCLEDDGGDFLGECDTFAGGKKSAHSVGLLNNNQSVNW